MKRIALFAVLTCICLAEDHPTQLVGSWKVVKYVDFSDKDEPYFPFGMDPVGLFIYTSDGHVSVQVVCDQKGPVPALLPSGAFDQVKMTYLGYFGTYTADPAKGTLVYHLRGASVPSYINLDNSTVFRFEGDHLVISGESVRGDGHKWRVERVLVKDTRPQ